ncbi:MAG: T9SS type A sorting domain-containing protein [Patescibacteria group bacterium]
MKARVLAIFLACFAANQALAGIRIELPEAIAMSGTGATITADFVGNDQVLVTVKPSNPEEVAHYGIVVGFNPGEYRFVETKGASVFRVENDRVVLASSYVFNGPSAGDMGVVFRKISSEWGRLEPQGLDMFTRNRERRVYEPAPAFTPNPNATPKELALQNYPNPFNPSTEIGYTMPNDGTLELAVYNLLGQKVVTLVNGQAMAGDHIATWNGTDDVGQPVSAGMYLCQLRAADGQTAVLKMILAK